MTKFSLAQAIDYIQFQTGKVIDGIQYEDGSGRKFIVQFRGSSKREFVKL